MLPMKCFLPIKHCAVITLSLLVCSCAQRTSPAPVTTVSTGIVLEDANNNSITSNKYKVLSGETLYSIAWRADLDVRDLAKINKISPPYNIYPGQVLALRPQVNKALPKNITKSTVKSSNNSTTPTSIEVHKKAIAEPKKQEYVGDVREQKVAKNETVRKDTRNTVQRFSTKVSTWQWPSRGKIINYFSSRVNGVKGLDFAGNKGDAVKAAANGKVVYAGNALRGYGNLIIVKHNDDYLSAYAHNERLLVKEKDTVKAGQKIALMGNSGAERVMLHFEIRFRGKSVNPTKYLPKK